MLMEDQGPSPDGLGQEYWMAPQVPYAVRQRIETVFEVLSHLPLEQPVAVVSDAGKTIALNAPLLKIVGGALRAMVLPASETTATGCSSGRCGSTSNTVSIRWRTAWGTCGAIQYSCPSPSGDGP